MIVCAVLSRCGLLSGGETLKEHADRQADETKTETDTALPERPSSNIENSPNASIQKTGSSDALFQSVTEGGRIASEMQTILTESGVRSMNGRITYQNGFFYEPLNETIKNRITGISYPADDSNAEIHYDNLCYVNVLYYNFNDREKVGEIICNKAIAQDLVEIFYELYQNNYQIEKIRLIDEYQGDDELSMKDNNSSCFNYRPVASTNRLSNHAYGLAIDINPFFNPYVTYRSDGSTHISPEGSEYYVDRDKQFAYKIDKNDLAYQLFTEHGFTWGGSWNHAKDYQHFQKIPQ